jgi:hypothetical protein
VGAGRDVGLKKNNPGCACCALTPPCPCYRVYLTIADHGVPYNQYYPTVFNLTVSGLTDDNCDSCDTWNGEFELCWDATEKDWRSPASSTTACGHSSGDPLYKLEVSPGGVPWGLTALGLGYSWELAAQAFDPFGSNNMELGIPVDPNPCNDVPDPVVVTACIPECDGCSTKDTTISVTLSGWPDFDCDCSEANDTFVLRSQSPFEGQCHYSFRGDMATCQSLIPPVIYIKAYTRNGPFQNLDNVGWAVFVTYETTLYNWELPGWIKAYSSATYWWDSGGVSAFDCTATRTLTLVYEENTGNLRPCGFLAGTTCQIN